MALKNTRLVYQARNFATGLTDVTADIRRNGVSVATGVALSELGAGRYELLLTPAVITGYGGSGYYDFFINSASRNAPASKGFDILENNEDDLALLIAQSEAKIDIMDANIDQVLADTTSIKSTVEDSNTKLSDGTSGLVAQSNALAALQSLVSNISNVTRFNAPIPPELVRQGVGTRTYKVPVYLYDNNGNMEDPDSNQIQLQIEDESGNTRDNLIAGFAAQPHYIQRDAQGEYFFNLEIPDTAALEQLNFKFSYVEGTKNLTQGATAQIVTEVQSSGLAQQATVDDILIDTADMQPRVADIQTKINDASFGLSALKALLDTITSNTDGVEGELTNATYGLAAIKTQIDLLATQSSVNSLTSSVNDVKGAGFNPAEDSLEQISERIYTGGTVS